MDITFKGYIRNEPEMIFTPTGKAITKFWCTDTQHGEYNESHNIVTWEDLAEIVNYELCQGAKVYIRGYTRTRSWEGSDGQIHSRTELTARKIWELDDTPTEMNTARELI